MSLRAVARSNLAYWAVAVAVALATTLLVAGLAGRASSLSSRYGALRPVVVADRDIGLGRVIEADDVSERQVPASLVPGDAPDREDEVLGRVVVAPAVAGLPLVPGHLAPTGSVGLSALVPDGSRAVAVPNSSSATPVRAGDRVDVLATLDPAAAPDLEPTFVVAAAAVVVDVTESAVTVAVSPDEAKRVAYSTVQGAVTLSLLPLALAEANDAGRR